MRADCLRRLPVAAQRTAAPKATRNHFLRAREILGRPAAWFPCAQPQYRKARGWSLPRIPCLTRSVPVAGEAGAAEPEAVVVAPEAVAGAVVRVGVRVAAAQAVAPAAEVKEDREALVVPAVQEEGRAEPAGLEVAVAEDVAVRVARAPRGLRAT
jgi:hypothetical protein